MQGHTQDGKVVVESSDKIWSTEKWALGSITMNKASRCDGITTELFKI